MRSERPSTNPPANTGSGAPFSWTYSPPTATPGAYYPGLNALCAVLALFMPFICTPIAVLLWMAVFS